VIHQITGALAKRMVNLRLVEAGTSELCATLVVDNKDLETAIREIYRTISEDTDGR
jgi:aspartokinase